MASELTVQTIKGPSSGGNANKILIPAGQELHAPGHVIQVVNNQSNSGSISTTSGQYISTPYTATITPKFSSSKIYVDLSFSVLLRGGGSGAALGFSLKRGSTRITSSVNNPHEMFFGDATLMANRQHYAYLDSPNTTSSTTYSLEAYPRYSQTTEFDSRNSTWSMTLWEIAQ
tara:strand:+ start:19280 stop:19798 length:519 start_codon:yes stop_codon:yes gene_type:complete